jgi:hypothetical protein
MSESGMRLRDIEGFLKTPMTVVSDESRTKNIQTIVQGNASNPISQFQVIRLRGGAHDYHHHYRTMPAV